MIMKSDTIMPAGTVMVEQFSSHCVFMACPHFRFFFCAASVYGTTADSMVVVCWFYERYFHQWKFL